MALDALDNGGDIDYENGLIFDPTVAQNYRARMSPAEIEIFNELNMNQQTGYLRAAGQAWTYSEYGFPQPVRNRKGDAIKHTLFNALSTIYIGEALTEQLTTAHEDIEYQLDYPNHFKETQMDLYNNAQGRQIANEAGFFGNIRSMVEESLSEGRLRYLNNLEFSNGFWRATDESILIPTNH